MSDEKSTEVGMFGGAGMAKRSPAEVAAALKQSSQEGARGSLPDGGVYVSFSGKLGKYSIGVDKDDADPDELWLVNIYDFQRGWICWKGGRPVSKIMSSIYEDAPVAPDPSEHGPFDTQRGEGWFPAKSISLRSIDRGIQGLFQTNTKSAVSEFAKLEGIVSDAMSEGTAEWPVISLKKESFVAQGQKNYKPVLDVYGMLGMEQITRMAEMDSIEDVADSLDDMILEAAEGKPAQVEVKKKKKKKKAA